MVVVGAVSRTIRPRIRPLARESHRPDSQRNLYDAARGQG
jgi:hypothetical protein